MELFDLTGKVAIVTGGGSGLGRVFCEALAEAGAKVCCADLLEDRAQETVKILTSKGGKAVALRVDVTQQEQVQYMVEQTVKRLGGLDIAVNNAGIITRSCHIHEMTLDDWDRSMAVNLRAVFLCMQEELKVMLIKHSGSIINTASIAGLVGFDTKKLKIPCTYAVTKHAIIGLTRQAAIEYAKEGIRINALAPGWHIGTHIGDESWSGATEEELKQFEKTLYETIPMGRTGKLNEEKGSILYLASELASSYVTGSVITSDGGYTAW